MNRYWARVSPEPEPPASMPQRTSWVIEAQAGGIFLLRHTLTGAFGGGTWHQSIDEARDQAEREYGGEIEWLPILDGETDAVAYALRAARPHVRRRMLSSRT